MANARKSSKEQAAQEHNSRILRKMPAPAPTSGENIIFPVGLRVGPSGHRNTSTRSPVLPPINKRNEETFSTSSLKSSPSAGSLTPPNSIRSNESFDTEVEPEKVKHSRPSNNINTKNWPSRQIKSIQNACTATKPFVESSVMLLLSLLFTLFTLQSLMEIISTIGLWTQSE